MQSWLPPKFGLILLQLVLICPTLLAPPVGQRDGHCQCGKRSIAEMEPISLQDSAGHKLELLQDKKRLGKGGYSEVYHALLATVDGKSRNECVALKYTLVGKEGADEEEQRRMHKNALAQKNEWTVLDGYKRKVLDKDVSRRPRRVIQLFHKGEKNEHGTTKFFSAMELGSGDLFDTLTAIDFKQNPLTDNLLKQILQPVVLAIIDLHEGIIHGDIKAENFVNVNGVLKVIDFNGSQLIRSDTSDLANAKQQFEDMVFTPSLGAPECTNYRKDHQGRYFNDLSPKTDVWAFGMGIYQILLFDRDFERRFVDRWEWERENKDKATFWDVMTGLTRFYRKLGEADDLAGFLETEWDKSMLLLELMLRVRASLPRNFHLITATLSYAYKERPTMESIHQFQEGNCRFASQGQGTDQQIGPNLRLGQLAQIVAGMCAVCEKKLNPGAEKRGKAAEKKSGIKKIGGVLCGASNPRTRSVSISVLRKSLGGAAKKWKKRQEKLNRVKRLLEKPDTSETPSTDLPICATKATAAKRDRRDRNHELSGSRERDESKDRQSSDIKRGKRGGTSTKDSERHKSTKDGGDDRRKDTHSADKRRERPKHKERGQEDDERLRERKDKKEKHTSRREGSGGHRSGSGHSGRERKPSRKEGSASGRHDKNGRRDKNRHSSADKGGRSSGGSRSSRSAERSGSRSDSQDGHRERKSKDDHKKSAGSGSSGRDARKGDSGHRSGDRKGSGSGHRSGSGKDRLSDGRSNRNGSSRDARKSDKHNRSGDRKDSGREDKNHKKHRVDRDHRSSRSADRERKRSGTSGATGSRHGSRHSHREVHKADRKGKGRDRHHDTEKRHHKSAKRDKEDRHHRKDSRETSGSRSRSRSGSRSGSRSPSRSGSRSASGSRSRSSTGSKAGIVTEVSAAEKQKKGRGDGEQTVYHDARHDGEQSVYYDASRIVKQSGEDETVFVDAPDTLSDRDSSRVASRSRSKGSRSRSKRSKSRSSSRSGSRSGSRSRSRSGSKTGAKSKKSAHPTQGKTAQSGETKPKKTADQPNAQPAVGGSKSAKGSKATSSQQGANKPGRRSSV